MPMSPYRFHLTRSNFVRGGTTGGGSPIDIARASFHPSNAAPDE
jgi:hypothetical protein